jgi:hypothetical protein
LDDLVDHEKNKQIFRVYRSVWLIPQAGSQPRELTKPCKKPDWIDIN